MFNIKETTQAELKSRAAQLVGEIEANEQENEIFQRELNSIYSEIYLRKEAEQTRTAATRQSSEP